MAEGTETPARPGRRARKPVPGTAAAGTAVVASAATKRPARTKAQAAVERRRQVEKAMEVRAKLVAAAMNGLTAAAELMDPQGKGVPKPNAATRTWQHAAWGYVRTVPELNAAKMYVGNCLSMVKLRAAKRNPDGTVDAAFDGTPLDDHDDLDGDIKAYAEDIVSRIRTTIGGQSEFMRSSGEKAFIAGELFWLPKDDAGAGAVFDVMSTQELLPSGRGYTIYWGPGYQEEPLPEGTQPIRVWRRDAQFSRLADSSVRSCLEILEELVILTRLVRASAISRMALAGVLLLPDTLDSPQDDEETDGGLSESMNPLATDMINTGAKAIDDPASASAWMPYILQGTAEDLQHIRHIAFQADDAVHVVKRQEALERLAQGLDLPVEVILGHRETTFANARQISEDTFKIHIKPTIQLICDAATECILWPALAKKLGYTPAQIESGGWPDEVTKAAVHFDASQLISRPDRSKDVIEAFKADASQMAIRLLELRGALGLSTDPDDMPDDEEIARRVDAIRLTKIREVISAPPGDAAVPIDQAAADAPVPGQSGGQKAIEDNAKANKALPAGEPDAATQEALKQAALAHRIAGAADLAAERGVSKIGAKLRTKVKGVEREMIEGVPNALVASVLGPRVVTELLADGNPFDAEVADLTRLVARWAADAGVAHPGDVAERAGLLAAAFAKDRLYGAQRPVTYELTAALVQ